MPHPLTQADKEMAKLTAAAASPELQKYIAGLKGGSLICMHVMSQRWNAAANARLLLGIFATLLFMIMSGWYRHLFQE
jgi:hypothetical protein